MKNEGDVSEKQRLLWEQTVTARKARRLEESRQSLLQLLDLTEDPEKQAFYHLSLGQLLEQIGDFEAAIAAYCEAAKREPVDHDVSYFTYNNLGFCLIQLERHGEAEPHCRLAISIDPARHNAHKNLGLSLIGQGKLVEAAQSLVVATRLRPSDGRALQHLEQLVKDHPELLQEWPELASELEQCREAVMHAWMNFHDMHPPN